MTHSPTSPAVPGRTFALLVGLAALLGLIVWQLWPTTSTAPASLATAAPPSSVASAFRVAQAPPSPSLAAISVITHAAPPGTLPPALPPILDAIELEKQKVCIGEENLVTIRAHTPGNTDDAYLAAGISGRAGFQIPLVGRRQDVGAASEPYVVSVVSRDGQMIQAPVPPFEVMDCMQPYAMTIKIRRTPNGGDEMELWAQVSPLGVAEPFLPAEYHWEFGDGEKLTSTTSIVSHDYSMRPADSAGSTFLVTATAVATNGTRVVARRELVFRNQAFEMVSQRGMVLIESRLTPRFAERDADGVVHQKVAVWQRYKQPVEVTEVVRTRYAEGEALSRETLNPSDVLGSTTLRPGTPIEIERALDANVDPRLTFETFTINGRSADGLPASGEFSIMVPPKLPDTLAEMPDRVEDPLLAAKIVRAQQVLGKRFVTDEELYRLEREGAFAGLAPRDDLVTADRNR